MNSIEKKAQQIIEDFSYFEDWNDKYEHIIDLGKKLTNMDEADKNESNLVHGCQSKVWLTYKVIEENGEKKMHFSADSDAIITKGLVALILDVVQNESPNNIANYDFNFISKIGLKDHLSPTRANGLSGMIKKINTYAQNV